MTPDPLDSRELTDLEKIQAKSCPEIVDGIIAEAKRLKRKGLKWKHKISHGPLINFLIAWYLDQSPDQREQIAKQGSEVLVRILGKPYEAPPTSAPPHRSEP
jgi:hypothetical protein